MMLSFFLSAFLCLGFSNMRFLGLLLQLH
jgi:hypothetical protein